MAALQSQPAASPASEANLPTGEQEAAVAALTVALERLKDRWVRGESIGDHQDALNAALRLAREGETERALRQLDRAIDATPQVPEIWRSKAQILGSLGRVPEAVAVLDQALARISRDEPRLLADKADFQLLDDDFAAAAETFDRLIAAEPQSLDHRLGKGRALLSEDEAEEALKCAGAALALDPNSVQAHMLRGDALLKLKRWDEGFAAFAEAARRGLGQFGSTNWAARGDEFRQNGQSELALRAYQEAIDRDPHNPEGYHGRGMVLRERGDVDGAIEAFARGSEVDSNFITGFLDAGALCAQHDRLSEALEYFESASVIWQQDGTSVERNDTRPWLARGDIYERMGRNEEAQSAYQRATTIDPQNADAWNYLGNVQAHLDHIEDAIASYRRAIELRPNFGWPKYNLALTLLPLQQFDEALKSADQAIAIEPDNSDFWIGKLIVLNVAGRFDQTAVDGALGCPGADDKLRVEVASFLADSDRLDPARALLRGIDVAQIAEPESRLDLGESLLLIGEARQAADVLADINGDALNIDRRTVRTFLHLVADRLARGEGPLLVLLFDDFLNRLKARIADCESRGGKWGYVSIGWNFRGVRRLVERSQLPSSDRFALTTLIDLAEGRIHPRYLSFLAEAEGQAQGATARTPVS
jgi:tetratricopeptide (TPR) repeat protein